MATRPASRQTARRQTRSRRTGTTSSLFHRPLRYEPLEDRRLLALVTVQTLDDSVDLNDGLTSLREAIFATNLVAGPDTIDFAPALTATGPATLTLTQGELKITDSLTINGPGAELLTIDAGGNDPTPDVDDGFGSRVFHVSDGNSSRLLDVAIFGLTLTGGDSNSRGGAIYTTESTSIHNAVLTRNASAMAGGGALAAFIRDPLAEAERPGPGHLNVVDSTISGNTARGGRAAGGAVYAIMNRGGTITIEGTVIVDNKAAQRGGGIAASIASGGRLDITESTLLNNSAQGSGGGLYLSADSNSDASIQDTTISHNNAGRDGGGAYIVGQATIAGSRFDNNSARNGGAIAAHSTLELNDSLVERNDAVFGGGIWIGANGRLFANNATIQLNTSIDGLGGGIGGEGPVTIVDSRVVNNVSQGHGGGGIGTTNSVTVENSLIQGNKATSSGGGISTSGALIVRSSTITGNGAGAPSNSSASGGGIYLANTFGSPVTAIEASTISGNFAAGAGGGIGTRSDRQVKILNTTISGNTARMGGAASVRRISLSHSTVTDNSAILFRNDFGVFGGIRADATTLNHSIIAGNREVRTLAPDLSGPVDARFSLIGNNQGTKLVEAPVGAPDPRGNLTGGPLHGAIDPLLAPLADNGGPTMTHALLGGSPAINAGDLNAQAGVDLIPLYDQRGEPFTRVFGGRIDIGAFEAQPNPLAGDYNFDGMVDMADYLVWRETQGSLTDLRADGNTDGKINEPDRDIWRANFGRTRSDQVAAIAEMQAFGTTRQPPVDDPQWRTLPGVTTASIATPLRSRIGPPAKPGAVDHTVTPRRGADMISKQIAISTTPTPRDAALGSWLVSRTQSGDSLVDTSSTETDRIAKEDTASSVAALDRAFEDTALGQL